ncbi:hypothetical protein FJC82_16930 [Escherichia coli]|uniref:hypothetical protein n=1 Tax=Escherichia coli TaxID=562 RepID=UPI001C701AA2|nr:hypothetical protein [Escherichia coli]MBW9945539.1 hypothetical protein [Escherichia coli]
MLRHIDRITWRNGWHLNGRPAHVAEIQPIFDGRMAAALSVWEQYESRRVELRDKGLSNADYEAGCRQIAEALEI